jgi:hypothetical protein
VSIYGAAAGNFALTGLAVGGVYLGRRHRSEDPAAESSTAHF